MYIIVCMLFTVTARFNVWRSMKSYSLVPSLPDLFNAREKRGGAWYLKSRDRRMPIYKGRKRGGS